MQKIGLLFLNTGIKIVNLCGKLYPAPLDFKGLFGSSEESGEKEEGRNRELFRPPVFGSPRKKRGRRRKRSDVALTRIDAGINVFLPRFLPPKINAKTSEGAGI